MRLSMLAPIAFATAAAGCATSAPYAEVSRERDAFSDPYEATVELLAVDGDYRLGGQKSMKIDPGKRTLLINTSRTRHGHEGHVDFRRTATAVSLDAKACMRYYFVARHQSMSDSRGWQAVLAKSEPIPECVAKYPNAELRLKSGG